MTPSWYRFTPVAWLRLDFCPKSRATHSTCRKCRYALKDWQHLLGQPVKLEILALLHFGIKMGNSFFLNCRDKNMSANTPGLIKIFLTWGTLLNVLFAFNHLRFSHIPQFVFPFSSLMNMGSGGSLSCSWNWDGLCLHSVAFPPGHHGMSNPTVALPRLPPDWRLEQRFYRETSR